MHHSVHATVIVALTFIAALIILFHITKSLSEKLLCCSTFDIWMSLDFLHLCSDSLSISGECNKLDAIKSVRPFGFKAIFF